MTGNRVALEVLAFDERGFLGSTVHASKTVSVGSDPDAALQLDDPSVSPKHAVFFLVGDDYCIKDLGSLTGTWVNGAPAFASQVLGPKDEITIGAFRLRIKVYKATTSDSMTVARTLERPPESEDDEDPTAIKELPLRARKAAAQATPAPDTDDFGGLLGLFDELRANEAAAPGAGASSPVELPSAPSPVSRSDTVPLAWAPAEQRGGARRAQAVTPSRMPVAAAPVRAETATIPVEFPKAAFAPVQTTQTAVAPVQPSAQSPAHRPRAPEEPVPAEWSAGWDDDDDDDSNFVPSFDLLEALSARGLPAGVPARDAVVEAIEYSRDRVISMRHLGPGQVLRLPGSEVVIGRSGQTSGFALETKTAGSFAVWQAGRRLSPQEVELLAGGGALELAPGMQIAIDVRGDDKVMLHLVQRAPALPRPRMSLGVDKNGITSGASSTLVHVVALALLGLLAMDNKAHEEADLNAGRFATIDMKELELEPPPPAPEPAPEVETPASTQPTAPQPTTPSPKKQPTAKNMSKGARATKPAAGPEPPAPSTAKILSSLGGAAPSTMTATAITNLDAAPHGAGGGFKISGAIGKAPGDGLKIAAAGSGSGQLDTKSATEVGANVGRVKGQGGTGTVRARVTAIPQAISGEGHLDRGEIQRVVNAHVHQVQACYERQLMKDPSLGGKITLEWVISGSGGVGSVRVKQSTVRSAEVASCIQSAIRGWKFPAPRGGAVTVTYPFAFSTLGN